MTRQLISVRQLVENLQEENLDLSQVFVDPDDIAAIPEIEPEE